MDESYHLREATFGSSPVLLIGPKVLPGKIAVKVGAPAAQRGRTTLMGSSAETFWKTRSKSFCDPQADPRRAGREAAEHGGGRRRGVAQQRRLNELPKADSAAAAGASAVPGLASEDP
jgi:hypothetical protein